jgi:MOSC domain-containing protein YiiM
MVGGTVMAAGRVEAIFVTDKRGTPLRSVASAHAVAGRGLEGDRHFQPLGPEGPKYQAQNELTLIEKETFEALARDLRLAVDPAEARRNILTTGVALNHLVGREFRLGGVRLKGLELCEPCGHLEKLTNSSFRSALIHRGGLRAAILNDGEIHQGDPITLADA